MFLISLQAPLTVFQCCSVDLSTGRARSGSVEGLDHNPVLGKLLEVVQGVNFTVSCRFHLHDTVLAIAARAVFSVANLVASDNAVLQLLLRSLEEINGKYEFWCVLSNL